MIVNLENIAALIEEIAQEEIAARFGRLTDHDIDTKTGPNDYVTEADRAAEARLQKALCGALPGSKFVGEELASRDPAAMDILSDDDPIWIVDPLDGTSNFVHGRERFGSIVALVEKQEIRAGWIYAIPDQAFAMGSKSDGASWKGDMLQAFEVDPAPRKGFRAIGSLDEVWRERLSAPLKAHFDASALRCSAYGYIDLLNGKRSFGVFARCWPWDHAAGAMMLGEISGRVEYLDNGEAYFPRATHGRPLLAASSDAIWRETASILLREDER